jgi:hypothetical protein
MTKKINLPPEEEVIFQDFKDGNSVQVRVKVRPGEVANYEKGKAVEIVRGDYTASARIISEPIEVGSPLEGEDRTLSLIVEKAD